MKKTYAPVHLGWIALFKADQFPWISKFRKPANNFVHVPTNTSYFCYEPANNIVHIPTDTSYFLQNSCFGETIYGWWHHNYQVYCGTICSPRLQQSECKCPNYFHSFGVFHKIRGKSRFKSHQHTFFYWHFSERIGASSQQVAFSMVNSEIYPTTGGSILTSDTIYLEKQFHTIRKTSTYLIQRAKNTP